MTQNREKHSVISHFLFGCHGNRFHVKSDKVPLFNSENLRKTAVLKSRPLLYQELFIKPYICKSYLRYSLNADTYNMCVISTCWHYYAREISTEWQNVKWEIFIFFSCLKETCKNCRHFYLGRLVYLKIYILPDFI